MSDFESVSFVSGIFRSKGMVAAERFSMTRLVNVFIAARKRRGKQKGDQAGYER